MARLRPTNLKCVSAVIRYKIVVNIFHYSAARVGGRSREPSRAWSERKGGVEGRSRGVESRPNRGKGRKGFFGRRRERLIRSALFQSFHRGSLLLARAGGERRGHLEGVEEASRRRKGGGPSTADPAFVCFRFRSSRMRIKGDTATPTWNVLLPPSPPLDDSPMLFRLISVKIVTRCVVQRSISQLARSLRSRRILKKNFEKDEKEGRVLAKEKW